MAIFISFISFISEKRDIESHTTLDKYSGADGGEDGDDDLDDLFPDVFLHVDTIFSLIIRF